MAAKTDKKQKKPRATSFESPVARTPGGAKTLAAG